MNKSSEGSSDSRFTGEIGTYLHELWDLGGGEGVDFVDDSLDGGSFSCLDEIFFPDVGYDEKELGFSFVFDVLQHEGDEGGQSVFWLKVFQELILFVFI